MTQIREFTDTGYGAFRRYLEAARWDASLRPPFELLESDEAATVLQGATVEARTFASRQELAAYLYQTLAGLPPGVVGHSDRMWAWLTLFYLDTVAPPDERGLRKVNKDLSRYLPDYSRRLGYRHLLKGRYKLYQLNADRPDRARLLLHGPVHVWSDLEEQILGVMELVRVPGALEAADKLYFDPGAGEAKRGVTNRKKGGTVRRLGLYVQQLDLTFDVYAMTGGEIVEMLPQEFRRFLDGAA